MVDEPEKEPCLWHMPDGKCANCKARRYRLDAMGMQFDYGICPGQKEYRICVFYKPK
jgi:hypothetical protein